MALSLILMINSKCNSRKTGNYHRGQVVVEHVHSTNRQCRCQSLQKRVPSKFISTSVLLMPMPVEKNELEKLFHILAGLLYSEYCYKLWSFKSSHSCCDLSSILPLEELSFYFFLLLLKSPLDSHRYQIDWPYIYTGCL